MIDERDVERIARRVVELLDERDGPPATSTDVAGRGLVDAETVAVRFGVKRGWVYEHAAELGARRLGEGPRAPLRFDLGEVERRVASCSGGRASEEAAEPVAKRDRRRSRPRRAGTSAGLLPIRGPAGAS